MLNFFQYEMIEDMGRYFGSLMEGDQKTIVKEQTQPQKGKTNFLAITSIQPASYPTMPIGGAYFPYCTSSAPHRIEAIQKACLEKHFPKINFFESQFNR